MRCCGYRRGTARWYRCMAHSETDYRQAAADCLEAARLSFDQTIRLRLIAIAQRYLDLASQYGRRMREATGPSEPTS